MLILRFNAGKPGGLGKPGTTGIPGRYISSIETVGDPCQICSGGKAGPPGLGGPKGLPGFPG